MYCEGYRDTISLMSSSFCAVNLNGIDGLFSGVSRCCRLRQRRNCRRDDVEELLTTIRESLRAGAVTLKARH